MKARAIQNNIHISPRKAALVCDLVRHKKVTEALSILEYTNKKIAPFIYKLLNQCIANATNNHAMMAEKLYIYSIVANQGHTLKRTSPRARGSADLLRKRHCHIEIILSDDPEERKKDVAKIAAIKKNRAEKNKGYSAIQRAANAGEKPPVVKKPKAKPVVKTEKPKPVVKQEPVKPAPKVEKPKVVNGVEVGKKHVAIKKADLSAYNYDKRRKQWKTSAGYNEDAIKCAVCKDPKHASILTETKKHICYTCFITKDKFENIKKLMETKEGN